MAATSVTSCPGDCSPPSVWGAPQPHVSRKERLLNGEDDFCASFWHVEPSAEAGVRERCMRTGRPCARKSATVVAVLRAPGRPDFVGRYTNCAAGNRTHAEEFAFRDPALLAALARSPPGTVLTLYQTYQPCHRSSGHQLDGDCGPSCTESTLAFHRSALLPRGIRLRIAFGYLYRAHWNRLSPADLAVYGARAASAADGLRMLLAEPGVEVSGMSGEDWKFLARMGGWMVERGVEYLLRSPGGDERRRMDRFIAEFLDGLRGEAAG
ncbi:APOBEC-like N-terminal domain-containing protein [Hyaloraphidium curvatum]|nr:APOBEC-like N-terminal domain-containing protein [Hyaloraphidium curvatum]